MASSWKYGFHLQEWLPLRGTMAFTKIMTSTKKNGLYQIRWLTLKTVTSAKNYYFNKKGWLQLKQMASLKEQFPLNGMVST